MIDENLVDKMSPNDIRERYRALEKQEREAKQQKALLEGRLKDIGMWDKHRMHHLPLWHELMAEGYVITGVKGHRVKRPKKGHRLEVYLEYLGPVENKGKMPTEPEACSKCDGVMVFLEDNGCSEIYCCTVCGERFVKSKREDA